MAAKNKKNYIRSENKERKEAFKALPKAIRENLTKEEKELFLNSEVWPESLFQKLSDFICPAEE
ncbi:MAG: hypothetical protein CSA18_01825 [Deltaproteobacteria bacterium]|nr:MAG: hypothetical protein CSA18_01825 [Deltaproteobacteria bacterium]